eukprot:m.200576 g.200576  ORF g.200576 m.200576 type:complete len:247 (+) comp16856_c8_seq1:76-816(+)
MTSRRRPLQEINSNDALSHSMTKAATGSRTCETIQLAMQTAMARKSGYQPFRRSFHLNGNLHSMTRKASGSSLEPDTASKLEEEQPPSSPYTAEADVPFSLTAEDVSRHDQSMNISLDDSMCEGVVICQPEYEDTCTFNQESVKPVEAFGQLPLLPEIAEEVEDDLNQSNTLTEANSHMPQALPLAHRIRGHQQQQPVKKLKPPTPRHPRFRSRSNTYRLPDLNKHLDTQRTAAIVASTFQLSSSP